MADPIKHGRPPAGCEEPTINNFHAETKVALNPDFETDGEKIIDAAFMSSKQAKWRTQEKRVYESLFESPKTRLQLSHYESIPIQNVCRYVGHLRKSGQVYVLRVERDPISGQKSEYLSTNPALLPKPEPATKILRNGQITLFH